MRERGNCVALGGRSGASEGGAAPFAAFERIAAEMDRRMAEMMRVMALARTVEMTRTGADPEPKVTRTSGDCDEGEQKAPAEPEASRVTI